MSRAKGRKVGAKHLLKKREHTISGVVERHSRVFRELEIHIASCEENEKKKKKNTTIRKQEKKKKKQVCS
jgi:hypothetical protein